MIQIDIDMPKTCDDCPFHRYHSRKDYVCVATPLFYPMNLANYKGGRKDFCPLKEVSQEPILDKIIAEITDCLKALDEIEKSGLNIYLPNEMSGRRLTYQQCLEFIDKYKAERSKE